MGQAERPSFTWVPVTGQEGDRSPGPGIQWFSGKTANSEESFVFRRAQMGRAAVSVDSAGTKPGPALLDTHWAQHG